MADSDEMEIIEKMEVERVTEIGRVLSYGIPIHIFIEKFTALSEKKDVLERIAERLATITTLGHESAFLSNPDKWDFHFKHWSLPSIQVYLYCACMDTLAGPPEYEKFEDWLTKQDDLSSLNVGKKHKEYLEIYGLGRNFKKLFTEYLSPKTRHWLNSNVAIQKSTEHEVAPERNEHDFIKRLQGYFYNYWRNPFTHESKDKPVDAFDSPNWQFSSNAENEWRCESTEITFGDSKTEWSLWHKRELDIFIIARIIIHSVVFQWLDIDITDELINDNVYRLQRLSWMYKYLHEIRKNADVLDLWKDVEGDHIRKFVLGLRSSGHEPALSYQACNKILEFFTGDFASENDIQAIQKYVRHVTATNTLIHSFNHEFHKRSGEEGREQEMRVFLLSLTSEVAYEEMVQHTRIHSSIWLLIRENHEYPIRFKPLG